MTTMQADDPVLDRNRKTAAMWSGGGRDYDAISKGVAEGIRHGVLRLSPRPGERVLDVATGTGWTARHVAASGARVTAVDIAEGLLEAGRSLADEEGVEVDWRLGDAERLPFPDAAFDAAISTYGVMFATDQEAALQELTRVVRPGGRIVVVAWTPGSNAVALRQVVGAFMPPAPAPSVAPPSPFNWGDRDWLASSLGDAFQLGHETGMLHHRLADPAAAWEVYSSGFPPVKAVAGMLEPARREEMRETFEAWAAEHRTDLGVAIPYEYMVTRGMKA